MSRSKLVEMLNRHEGRRSFVYKCPAGYWTIGAGRNVDPDGGGYGLSSEEIDYLLENDIIKHHKELHVAFPWYGQLDEVRQEALIDMHFMGHGSFCTFKKMIAALEAGDYKKAHDEALDSKWAKEDVQEARSTEIAMMIWRGQYKPDAT